MDEGTPVTLHVFSAYDAVPSLIGLYKKDAETLAKAYGLEAVQEGMEDCSKPEGNNWIYHQSPAADSALPPNGTVLYWAYVYMGKSASKTPGGSPADTTSSAPSAGADNLQWDPQSPFSGGWAGKVTSRMTWNGQLAKVGETDVGFVLVQRGNQVSFGDLSGKISPDNPSTVVINFEANAVPGLIATSNPGYTRIRYAFSLDGKRLRVTIREEVHFTKICQKRTDHVCDDTCVRGPADQITQQEGILDRQNLAPDK